MIGAMIFGLSIMLPPALAQEYEPNDSIATATTTGLSGLGTVTISDVVLGNGPWGDLDVDVYRFDIDAASVPAMVTVELQSLDPALDGLVRLFDDAGAELANNDDRDITDVNPRLRTYLLAAGDYFVGAGTTTNPHYDSAIPGEGRPGAGGAYTLAITTESAVLPESPFEPNDQVATGAFMGTTSFTLHGEFIGDGEHGRVDVDVYKIRLVGPARIDVQVISEALGSTLDPVVRLRNCEENVDERTFVDPCLLGAGDDAPDGSTDSVVSVGVVEPMDVFIMVSGAGNRRYDPATPGSGETGSVGLYDLVVNVTTYEVTGQNEPNDSILTATALPHVFVSGRPETIVIDEFLGDGHYAPFLGDRDFYKVTIMDDVRWLAVDVEAESIGSGLDPIVAVYDLEGDRIAINDNDGDSADAHLVLPVECLLPASEETISAYVMVAGTKQRLPQDVLTPHVETTVIQPPALVQGPGSTGPYRLTLHVEDVVEGCANEPDDTLATATNTGLVDEGSYACIDGMLGDASCPDPAWDVDVWSVNVLHAPASLDVSVSTCQTDATDEYTMVVADAQGDVLASRYLFIPDDEAPSERTLRTVLEQPGIYYVALVDYFEPNDSPPLDLFEPCSFEGFTTGTYDLVIRLRRGSGAPNVGGTSGAAVGGDPGDSALYATRIDAASNRIDRIDPSDGTVTEVFPAPEARFGGSEGLAYDGSNLYYVGVGRYPRLYRLDPGNGDVLDDYVLWMGSGFFSDAVMLGDELFLLDYHGDSVHVIDPIRGRFLRTLDLGWQYGVTLGGGLAALAGPNRLYAADAFGTQRVYEVDPLFGIMTNSLPPSTNRPMALAGSGTSVLYAADWEFNTVELIQRDGTALGEFSLPSQVGSLAGQASVGPYGDFDFDGDIDLMDYAALQRCFTGPFDPQSGGCGPGDGNGDGQIDLADFAGFLRAFTGLR